MDQHIFVAALVHVFQIVTALRTQFALNVYSVVPLDFGPQLRRDQMQRLLVHRTIFDGIDGAVVRPSPILQPSLQEGYNRGLAAPNRAHQQENPLADFESLTCRLEILDYLGYRPFYSEEFFAEKIVSYYFVAGAFVDFLNAGHGYHVAQSSVRQLGHDRVLQYQFEVIAEGALPRQSFPVAPVCL